MRIAEGRARQYGVPFFSPINERGAHVMNCRRMMSVILSGVLSIFCLSTVAKEDREDRNDREARHQGEAIPALIDRKSTRLNSSHRCISYAVFCLKKKKTR